MKPDGVEFSRVVAEIVRQIPSGYVISYGDLAALAGFPSHARLAGRTLASIGMDSDVPCHRVVNASGRTAPHWLAQRARLEAEGVRFKPNGCVDMRLCRWKW